jgi:hypothetical protein
MTSIRTRLLALAATVVVLLPAAPALVQAAPSGVTTQIQQGLTTAAGGAGYDTSQNGGNLTRIIGSLINTALSLLGVLLLLYLLYGGFIWMTAGGDEAKVKKARALITNTVIGLVIIVIAFALSNFILTQLATAVSGGTGQ